MARITVEDCLNHVENRFSLVLIAAERTHQLMRGRPALLDASVDNKEVVTALREVAAGLIGYHDQDPNESLAEDKEAETKQVATGKDDKEQMDTNLMEPEGADVMDAPDDAELDLIGEGFPDAIDA